MRRGAAPPAPDLFSERPGSSAVCNATRRRPGRRRRSERGLHGDLHEAPVPAPVLGGGAEHTRAVQKRSLARPCAQSRVTSGCACAPAHPVSFPLHPCLLRGGSKPKHARPQHEMTLTPCGIRCGIQGESFKFTNPEWNSDELDMD